MILYYTAYIFKFYARFKFQFIPKYKLWAILKIAQFGMHSVLFPFLSPLILPL